MKKTLFILALSSAFAMTAAAQGVRDPKATVQTENKTAQTGANLPKPQPAPTTFAAKYSGGLFGFSQKMDGTLNFDETNKRLVFRNKENKEIFALPYKSFLVIYPNSKSVTPTAARVAGAVPILGAGLANFITTKQRYLVVQFEDPDSNVQGTASFKLGSKELLQSVIYSLGEKAELKQRGDSFYRPRPTDTKTVL
ncbi:MAG: hypothetical protein M3209_14805 [Acidobacteriota bacterium]|nr:hypothetical protein [Acidobacteriota bacterium]